ncbi:DUF262 domain-containing protein [Intestinimonas butyriciproducens]|jgi:hypothetical protein|uniref:DUF262 domain-containing protein n=1 Tax=Intestinimonas butyriciproducens TaxID=1297617 RepID=UPI001FA7ABD4|nr:DUF262 domain-containing protein [Intestinimonas butyriciproducens]
MIMKDGELRLESKLVGSITGDFFVPSYQRGYRWGSDEVKRLLDDIYSNGQSNYCLQPVVVRKLVDSYELIDGQQRLTTLFLIYKYMHSASFGFIDEPKFTLRYETRAKSEEFLRAIDLAQKEENIDYWFICNAYQTIEHWFESKEKKSVLTNINKYFDENVKIIWYEVGESEDAIALFARLNIGKILLTSAELVKAMFLSNSSNTAMTTEKQQEISLQWDRIEQELHDDALWYFLTNRISTSYQTRIDLLLDLISGKTPDEKEKYFTFFYFDHLRQQKSLDDIWSDIQHTFLTLKDWYENHALYHKIGYLIASDSQSLQQLYALSIGKTKREFNKELDRLIRESIHIGKNYAELSYENSVEYSQLSRLLLLFNVESVRQIDGQTQRFPFHLFKYQNTGKVAWSLEHIHAQNSKGMRKQEQWKEWLRLHIPSVEVLCEDDGQLLADMQAALAKQPLLGQEFEPLSQQVTELLSLKERGSDMHAISNLALLNMSDNAALSNATFDVKRNAIVEMDKAGQYIPFCTKMVFLKYYTPSAQNQLHFWGQPDRVAYIEHINRILEPYLEEKISMKEDAE